MSTMTIHMTLMILLMIIMTPTTLMNALMTPTRTAWNVMMMTTVGRTHAMMITCIDARPVMTRTTEMTGTKNSFTDVLPVTRVA